jgi:hypothetical protein
MAKWPYNTAVWKALRAVKLEQTPFCQHCLARGQYRLGTHVDHVVAISKGGDPFPPLDGLSVLCHPCHNQKTSGVDRPGGSGLAVKGCGPDGLPLDPEHHAWGDTASKDEELGSKDRQRARAHTYFEKARRPWD